MRFRQHAAFQPAKAAFQQWRADLFGGECGQSVFAELIQFAAGCGAHRERGLRHFPRWNVQCEFAGRLDQFARERVAVDDHRHLGWREIERHRPCRSHDIACAFVLAAHQHGRAVIEKAIGFGEIDRETRGHVIPFSEMACPGVSLVRGRGKTAIMNQAAALCRSLGTGRSGSVRK